MSTQKETSQTPQNPVGLERSKFVQRTFKVGLNPEFDLTKARQIADEMDDEERLKEMQLPTR